MAKFYNIDPYKCTKAELEKAIEQCELMAEFYHIQEQAVKIFLNSVYGAMASKYYICNNVDMAESITLQGQDLIKYSVIVINEYFDKMWHMDYEMHDSIASKMKEKYPEFDIEIFLKNAKKKIDIKQTLQAYGDTDSIDSQSVIHTEKHPDGITIEQLYNENVNNPGGNTLVGHESVFTNDKVLNWTESNELYYGNVKRIIRHKVNKTMWSIEGKHGQTILCTADHSLVVFRNGKQIVVKPSEIKPFDTILCVMKNSDNSLYWSYSDIVGCNIIGEFEDEYVYDIEMDDESHTFIANDILVHNSAYISLQPLIESCGIPEEMSTDFILVLNDVFLDGFLNKKFDEYAEMFNCPENKEKFELEKIARSTVLIAKKNYFMDIAWTDDGSRHKPLSKLVIKGFDVVKGSTPEFCRKSQKDFIKYTLDEINNGRKPEYMDIVERIGRMKTGFAMQSPNDISKNMKISDYEKYIIDDKKSLTFVQPKPVIMKRQDGTTVLDITGMPVITGYKKVPIPIHVRAAAVYNNMLYTTAKKYMSKYNILKKGDKVKFYYTSPEEVFGFVPDSYPMEFAPKMDVQTQFEKMLLEPINRIVNAIGYPKISSSLTYTEPLW